MNTKLKWIAGPGFNFETARCPAGWGYGCRDKSGGLYPFIGSRSLYVSLQQPTFISCQACAFVFAGFAQRPVDFSVPPVFAQKFFVSCSRSIPPCSPCFPTETTERRLSSRGREDRGESKKKFWQRSRRSERERRRRREDFRSIRAQRQYSNVRVIEGGRKEWRRFRRHRWISGA